MSFDDIDMKSYAGAIKDPAAAGQQIVDTNSYQQEVFEEFPSQQELYNQASQMPEHPVNEDYAQPTRQELNFKALRDEFDRLKAEREAEKREHQLQVDMLRANLMQQQYTKQPELEQPRKFLDGMREDDVPNVADLRKEWEQREAMYQAKLEELEVAQHHSDYAEVIKNYALPLVKDKPHLAQGLRGAENKALFAYELGKMAQQMQMQQQQLKPQQNPNAQRIVENSRKPGTLAQAGGQTVLSQADYYATMSDADFAKLVSRNLGEI